MEAKALHKQGMNKCAIARKMGVHVRQVRRWTAYDLQKYSQYSRFLDNLVIHRSELARGTV